MDETSSPQGIPPADLPPGNSTPTDLPPVNPAPDNPPPLTAPPPPSAPPPPPPTFTAPPPIIMPPSAPPPKRGGGRVWMVIAIIAIFALCLSLLSNIGNKARRVVARGHTTHEVDRSMEEVILERHHSDYKIAVIEVKGVITSAEVDRRGFDMMEMANDKMVRDQLKAAAKDDDVKAVILKVDSPGGEVLASDEIRNEIVKFQTGKKAKPVIASMGTLAASGGYYVSAPCRWIVANELTITGSIGVIMHGYNYRGLMNKIGLKPEVFKSGKFKDMLSGDKETDPSKISPEEAKDLAEERRLVQDLITETFGKFKKIVADGRKAAWQQNSELGGRELVEDWQDYADGRVFSGRQAKDLGFVDELGNFEKAVERAEKLAHIPGKATLVQYQKPFDIGLLFRLLGKTESQSLKVDIAGAAPKLQAGLLYYIMPTVLH